MGQGFKSLQARHFFYLVGIAQLARAPDCGSGGQGFDSLYPPHNILGRRQAVRHSTLTAAFVGSNPAGPAKVVFLIDVYDSLAQLAEHLTFNQGVRGSTPRWVTRKRT